MVWRTDRVVMANTWWEALANRESLPDWFKALVAWLERRLWTHMHTQTFKKSLTPWPAAQRYLNFLADHASSWMLREVCWAVEAHPRGHGSHIHAIWNTPYDDLLQSYIASQSPSRSREPCRAVAEPLYRQVKTASWNSLGGSRLWPLSDRSGCVAPYVLKYVVKGIRNLKRPPPLPWEPTPKEPMWGMWTAE